MTMSRDEHIKRHKDLHASLDELMADYITQTGKRLRDTNLLDFMHWSFQQTLNPTDVPQS